MPTRKPSSLTRARSGGRLAVVAYCNIASKRCTALNFCRKRPTTVYSCASTTTCGRYSRTSFACACASGVRSSRWSRLMSMPLALTRVFASAPSGLARGSTITLMRSSSDASGPSPMCCAMTSSASLPAGSSPCCWPTSSTVGLPERASAAGEPSPSRVKTSASRGTPRCDAPSGSSAIVMRGDEVAANR